MADKKPPLLDRKDSVPVIEDRELSDRVPLGSGAFGAVFKAKWQDRQVAVKRFNEKLIGDDPSSERELNVLLHLQSQHTCKHIIRLFGWGTHELQFYIVMELAPFSLDYLLHDHEVKKTQEYSITHSISWLQQLATALDYCHTEGIVHRDIKPANMLLFEDGTLLKVCDFGTAKFLQTSTVAQTFIGTPFYLAPEIMEGRHSYECDIFSFAITAWEIFTRHRPTLDLRQTEKAHPYTVFMQIGKGARPPTIIGLPKAIWQLIERCWAHNAGDRPKASQLVNLLNKIARYLHEDNYTDASLTSDYDSLLSDRNGPSTLTPAPADTEIRTAVPVVIEKATPQSQYYLKGLDPNDQPYIPILGNDESVEIYRQYCETMDQIRRAKDELGDLHKESYQLDRQIEVEDQKKKMHIARGNQFRSLLQEKKALQQELESLKSYK